jgi:hypothetical protein
MGSSVQSKRAAHHARVGVKVGAPEPVGQNDDTAATGLIFFVQKPASEPKASAQHLEDIG